MGEELGFRFDFAPGESHIALRQHNRCYYVPELFHKSPNFCQLCPLFIRDVLKSKSVLLIYGVLGIRHHTSGVIMINNHPIKHIQLVGRITSIIYREFDSKYGPRVAKFYYVDIDDCSDTRQLTISVRITEIDFLSAGLTMESCLEDIILVNGIVTQGVDRDLELRCALVEKIGTKYDLDVEVREWTKRLEFRHWHLEPPWLYEPPQPTVNYNYVPPLTRNIPFNQHQQNLNQLNLNLVDSGKLVGLQRDDSIILTKERNKSKAEVIELLSDDEDCVIIEPKSTPSTYQPLRPSISQ